MGGFLSREEPLCSWCGPHHSQLVFTNRRQSRRDNTSKRAYPRTTGSYATTSKRRKISSFSYNDKENDIIEDDDTIVIEKDDIIIMEKDDIIVMEKEKDDEDADDEDADVMDIVDDECEIINESSTVITDNDNNIVEEDVNIQRSEKEIINIVDSNSILLYNRKQNKSSSESDYEEWDDLSESKIMNIIGEHEK